jgi:LacI family transcriptional regulator
MSTPPPARRTAPTLEAVAAAAGVSRSTASRVLNGSSNVSPDAASSVRKAVTRLNYIPNRAARSLVNSQTMSIALVVPEDTIRFFGDPYFAAIVRGIAKGLEDSDYVLNLQLASPSEPSEKTVRYLSGGNVDGAFVASHHSGDHFLTSLSERLPVVFGGRPLGADTTANYYVDVDNTAAAAMGTRYLLDQGRSRVATIAGPIDMPAGIDRVEGWRAELGRAGLPATRLAHGDFTMTGGARAMRELLDAHPDLDSVFVASDLMAVGAMSMLRERGLSVPRDVAVVGFDDSPAAVTGDIQLTTVHQPSTAMGVTMAETMLALLRGEKPQREHILPTHMVVRDSA